MSKDRQSSVGAASMPGQRIRERGFALVATLWASTVLALIAAAVAQASREDLALTRNLIDATRAELAAEAGILRAILDLRMKGGPTDDTPAIRYSGMLEGAGVTVRVTDEHGRIDLNAAPRALLNDLFETGGLDAIAAASLAEAVTARRESADAAGEFRSVDEITGLVDASADTLRRVLSALTVYSGRPAPRRATATDLVRATLNGLNDGLKASESDQSEIVERTGLAPTPTAGFRREGREADPSRARSTSLLRLDATAFGSRGAVVSIEVVAAIERRRTGSAHEIWLWRRKPFQSPDRDNTDQRQTTTAKNVSD
jgi:general secretion pathway protein K